jgi:uncharacterized membrane protein YjgN (DUF898 family)
MEENQELIAPIENNSSDTENEESPIVENEKPVTFTTEPKPNHQFSYHGTGEGLFKIQIVNFLLRIITFNFYYPWAKANNLKYIYENTEFAGSRFTFHGTGKEMFIGYLKLLGLAIVVYGSYYYCNLNGYIGAALLIMVTAAILLTPIAIHGTLKYRLSRTSYKGIFFGYRGTLKGLLKIYLPGAFLTLFTLGIYSFWLIANIREYVLNNVRLGNAEMDYYGKGEDLFVMTLLYRLAMIGSIIGFLLIFGIIMGIGGSILGLSSSDIKMSGTNIGLIAVFVGIVYIAFLLIVGVIFNLLNIAKFNYHWNKTTLWQNQKEFGIFSNPPKAESIKFSIMNLILILFTMGIGISWATTNFFNFTYKYLSVDGDFDVNDLYQTEEDYRNATGEDLADFMDIDIA